MNDLYVCVVSDTVYPSYLDALLVVFEYFSLISTYLMRIVSIITKLS